MQASDIIIPLFTFLGTTSIWQYLQFRAKHKTENKRYTMENSSDNLYRDDLKDRVKNLETLLKESSEEKDEMRSRIETLIGEVNALRVEVDYLKRENDRLKG